MPEGENAIFFVSQIQNLEPEHSGALDADDHAKQRGLACAIGADDSDDATPRQVEVQILHQQQFAVSLAELVRDHHILAEARSGRDVDLEGPLLRALGFGEQLVVARDPRLGLRTSVLVLIETALRLGSASHGRGGVGPFHTSKSRCSYPSRRERSG